MLPRKKDTCPGGLNHSEEDYPILSDIEWSVVLAIIAILIYLLWRKFG